MNRRWSRLALALILGTGFACAWGIVTGWLAAIILDMRRGGAVSEQLTFKPNGAAVISAWESSGQRDYRDIRGRSIEIANNQPWLRPTALAHSPTTLSMTHAVSATPVDWNRRIQSFSDFQRPPAYWYFVTGGSTDSNAYFVGYDSMSAAVVGYIGLSGFTKSLPTANDRFRFTNRDASDLGRRIQSAQGRHGYAVEPSNTFMVNPQFPASGLPISKVYVLDDAGKVWQVDLRKHSANIVFEQEPVLAIGTLSVFIHGIDIDETRIGLRTAGAVITMNGQDEILRRVPIPADLRDLDFSWAETTVGDVLVHYQLPRLPWDESWPHRILRIDFDGRIKSDEEIAIATATAGPAVTRYVAAFCVPGIAPVATVLACTLPFEISTLVAKSYWEALQIVAAYFAPTEILAVLIGLVLAVLVYRREALYGSTVWERWAWAGFVILTGLPGWIGYRYSRRWPLLEACEACGRAVPRDRLRCQACSVEFPAAALRGIEVFA